MEIEVSIMPYQQYRIYKCPDPVSPIACRLDLVSTYHQ